MNESKKLRVYLSGKISGIEDVAIGIFQEAEDRLTALGYDVVNPTKLDHSNHDQTWESFMKVDLPHLFTCDHIYLLHNYLDSDGATWELMNALKLKITPLNLN